MRSYLLYSSSAHLLLIAALFLFLGKSFTPAREKAYYIDFVGPSSVVTVAKAAAKPGAAAPAKKDTPAPAPKKEKPDEDDFSSSSAPLPKPSILSSGAKLFDTEAPAAPQGEDGTPLIADTANFPYPWYITQVREALWTAWTERMPSGGSLRCTVRFNIARSGAARRVTVEKSSGNRLFDNAAESAAQSASPFQPLPDDFLEDELTVHVEFKAAD